MNRRTVGMVAGLVSAALCLFGEASAQGASVDQHSACMNGRMGAGVAAPCADASAIYFSPAALASQPTTVGVGVSLVRTGNSFEYDDDPTARIERDAEAVPVPQLFATYRVNSDLALGFGVWPPFGLGLEWPVCPIDDPRCEDPNFEGRFAGYDNSLQGLYLQPTIAYQVVPGRVSLGAGLDIVRMAIEVRQRIDAPQVGLGGVDIADVALKGDGWGATAHLGVLLQLTPAVAVGARYLHSVTADLDGDADFTQVSTGNAGADALLAPRFADGGPLADQGIASEIELPKQFVAGVAVRPVSELLLVGDYQWTDWSAFDRIRVDFQNLPDADDRELVLMYGDAHTFKLGAEYGPVERLALRTGFRYNTAAAPQATPFLPEGDRTFYSLGIGYAFDPGLTIDVSWQYISQPDREGTVLLDGPIVGRYSSTGQIFGITLSKRFRGGN